ncbi:MAG: hypothetical protein HY088_05680 [Ignavibacteriales bacterium]|nr:hypothetical protein [Ignavibacteriales bacterium]
MKRLLLILSILGIGTSQLSASPKTTDDYSDLGVSASFGEVGFFYNALRPYGEWIELEAGFHAWRPLHVNTGWRPYSYGRWVWTDFGWYWVSSEPFGWATFHYGRWFNDDYYGWVWVPDRTWGPAWVEWRYNDDYIGWSPLPPYASFSVGIGIRFTTRWLAPMHYWSFVRYRHFTSSSIMREVVPMEYTRRFIGTTRSGGRYEVDGDRVINRGIDRQVIERRGGYTRINRVEVAETGERGERFVRDQNQERIEVYRPSATDLRQAPERIEARRGERRTSLNIERIERPQRDQQEGTNRENTSREQIRSKSETPLRPEIRQENNQRRREETMERLREQYRRETDQLRPTPPRQFENRTEPRSRIQEMEKRQEQREIFRERAPREERREVAPPRFKGQEPRSAPPVRKESPRGSEPARREGRRGRD